MMSETAKKHHVLYAANVALAASVEELVTEHRGWNCVIRFYAALHLMNASLVDKRNIRLKPTATEHRDRAYAMSHCPELRDAPMMYRYLKDLSESVRYDADYSYSDGDRKEAVAWLGKIVAIVEPKLMRT